MVALLLINLALIAFVFRLFKEFTKGNVYSMLKELGLFEAAWAGFLFMFCLSHFFDIMEAMSDGQTLPQVAEKAKLIKLSVLCGFGISHLSIFTIIVIKLLSKRSVN